MEQVNVSLNLLHNGASERERERERQPPDDASLFACVVEQWHSTPLI